MAKEPKARGKRTPRPKSSAIANIMRPHKHEDIMAIAEKLVKNEDVGIGLINGAVLSQDDAAQEFKLHSEAMEDYKTSVAAAIKSGSSIPAKPKIPSLSTVYDPVIATAINRLNCRVAIQGQEAKHNKEPADWSRQLGNWRPGRYIADSVRVHHLKDLTRNIDSSNNLVSIGSYQYLIGSDESAIFAAMPSKTGNYAANIAAAKRLSFIGVEGLDDIVARFNNNIHTEHLDDGTHPGGRVHFLPNQMATWGYLVKGQERLSYDQIRKMVESKETGIRFVELDKPIVGNPFNQNQFCSQVQRSMSLVATKDDDGNTSWENFQKRGGKKDDATSNVWRNLFVQMRVDPAVWNCFGFENCQWGVVPVACFGDNVDKQMVRVVVGVRIGTEFSETRSQAKSRLGLNVVKVAKTVKTEDKASEKPKTEKKSKDKKAEVKPKKVKAKKKALKKVKSSDSPNKIEVENIEEPEITTPIDETEVIEIESEPVATENSIAAE